MNLTESNSNRNFSNLFLNNGNNDYLNYYELYLFYFNGIPSSIEEIDINCEKARSNFFDKYKNEIKENFYQKEVFENGTKSKLKQVYYILENIIVIFYMDYNSVQFLFRNTNISKVQLIIDEVVKCKQRKSKQPQEISLLISGVRGITTTSLKITKPKLKIEDNYNDDFQEIHKNIYKRLSKNNDKGLILLHGKPGTGKTSYIRYLISSVKKRVIFLPPNMANAITNPDLLSVLIDNPNSIFVIEDAENIVIDREQNGSSPVLRY